MSDKQKSTDPTGSRRHSLVRARTWVAVFTVCALAGVVIAAPAAWGVAPDAPGQPMATAADGQISVSFTPSSTGDPATSFTATCTSSDGGATGTGTNAVAPVAVTGLDNGHSYTCTVIATNIDGPSAASPASNSVTPRRVPDAPAAPTAAAGNGQITVTFVPPGNGGNTITGYTATCSASGGTTGVVSGSGSPILVGNLDNGRSYTCTVFASNSVGPGPASVPSNATVPNGLPDAPAKPNVGPGDQQVTVSFVPPFNGGTAITGYVASCTSLDNAVTSKSGVGSPIVVPLTNGTTYTCTVTATNKNGSSVSPPSNAVTPASGAKAPNAPARPSVAAGDSQIRVSFTQPANNGSPITSDTATCTSSNGGVSGTLAGTAPSITVLALTDGKTYTCTVFASNGQGDGPASAASPPVVPSRTPDAPAAPVVAGGDRRITVSFGPPTFDGGSAITNYFATCTSNQDGTNISKFGTTSPILITGLNNGDTYTCTVTAINANGPGAPSPVSTPVVPDRGPDTPAAPTVKAGDAQIIVAFGAPGNGGSPITGYAATCTSSNGGRRGTTSGPTSPLTVTGLTNGRTYTCTVAAKNARGNSLDSPPSLAVVPTAPVSTSSVSRGFRLVGGDGGVFTFGADRDFGSAAGVAQHMVVGMTTTPNEEGYWLVATDGGIFSYGNARFYGSTGAIRLNQPIVGMTSTPSGNGYWLVASDGGIFSYGDARFYGSTGAIRLNQPIVGMSSTPSGRGYWMVASDGGIFSFGDARFYGSPVGSARSSVVGMATTAHGHGYWIAAADGSVFHFGDAAALGGVTVKATRLPIRGIASTKSGRGYWLAAGDGGVFTFGDAPFIGWPGPLVLLASIRGVSR